MRSGNLDKLSGENTSNDKTGDHYEDHIEIMWLTGLSQGYLFIDVFRN